MCMWDHRYGALSSSRSMLPSERVQVRLCCLFCALSRLSLLNSTRNLLSVGADMHAVVKSATNLVQCMWLATSCSCCALCPVDGAMR